MTHKHVAVASLALLLGAIFASASTVTFTESVVATGTLGNNSFVNSLITLTATGDTSNVTPRGPGWFWLSGMPVSINIASLGTTAILTSAGVVGSCHDNSCPTTSQALVGFYDPTVARDILDTFSGAFNTYDLTTWIGPITGSSRINASTAFNTNNGSFQITSAGASTFTATVGQAIPIVNAGFQSDVLGCAPQCWDLGVIPGWVGGAGTRFSTFKPSTGPGGVFPGGIPGGGPNVAALGDAAGPGVITQDLGFAPLPNTTYTLTAYVGQRADFPLITYAVELVVGTTSVASDTTLRPAAGTFALDTVTYNSGSSPGTGHLIIRLSGGGGGQADFAQVALAASNVTDNQRDAGISVPVANFSFETIPSGGLPVGCSASGCAYGADPIPGWTNSGFSGQFQPGSNTIYFNYIPDGITVAYSNVVGGTITQSVGTVAANTTYTLQVDLGLRKDGYSSLGTAALVVGSTAVYATGIKPAIGNWSTFTAIYSSVAADVGKPLTIELKTTGGQGDFDNVRLNAVSAVAPSAPTLLSPSNGTTNLAATSQNLTWSAAAGAISYDVYFGTTNPPPVYASNLTVTTLALVPLSASTIYYWKVTAKNSAGSTDSGIFSFTVAANLPSVPTLLSPPNGATNLATSQNLTWGAAAGTTSYNVYFGTTNPPPLYSSNLTVTTLAVGPLTASTAYYWKVTAKNSSGSTDSAIFSFTVGTNLPSAPTLLSPANGATTLATSLTWGAAAGATTYDVYFGTTNPPPLYSSNLTVTTLAVGPLTATTTYYWKVTAKNSNGSTDSSIFSFVNQQGGWTDNFDSDVLGSFPTGWINSGNNAVSVDNTFYVSPPNSLRMYGIVGGCWAALAHRQVAVSPPFTLQISVRNGNEALSGCHPLRGLLQLNTGPSWTTPGVSLLHFDQTGDLWSGASSTHLASLPLLQWNTVSIGYELIDANTVRTTYRINGQPGIVVTRPAAAQEASMTWLAVQVGEGTAWFDNVVVTPGVAPGGAPSAPTLLSPTNGATTLAASQNLTWGATAGATSYDVYFGTTNPPPLYSGNLTVTTLAVGPLTASTTYYWKVKAKNTAGSADSAVFSFTVGSGTAPTLTSITPTRGIVGSSVNVTLTGTNFATGQTTVAVSGSNFGFRDITVGPAAIGVTSSGSSTLTATFTISDTPAVGSRDVTVTTPNGTSNPVTFIIDPRSSGGTRYSITDKGGFSLTTDGSEATIQVGYARIQPDSGSTVPAGLAVFGYRQANVLVSEAAVPASPLIQSGRIFAEVNGPVNTGVAIANPNPQPASINFYFTRVDGTASPSSTTTIPANGQIATFLDQAPFNVVAPFIGTFTFSSSSPVSVIALRGLVNERSEFLITTLPVADLTASTGQSLIFPHFADGGGWTTQILLVNPTDQRLTGTVQFFHQGSVNVPGAPLNLAVEGHMGTTFSYSVEARSSQRLRTAGQGAATQAGSVHLVADVGTRTPSGLLVFSYRPAGITVSETGVPNVPSGSVFRLYAEASSNFHVQTGLAIANAASSPVSVAFELTDLTGQSTGLSGSTVVPGNGQAAMFLNQIPGFSTLPTPFQGVLRIVGPVSGISVVGLRGRTNERGDFLITTTSPVDESGTTSSTEWLFPHIVDSGGYSTQLILFSGLHGQSATGTLQFVSQSGADLNLHFKDKNPGAH